MAKRGRTNDCQGDRAYWQSAALNQRWSQFFYNQLVQMALARFRWVGLPHSCDARYLELQLLVNQQATLCYDALSKSGFQSFFSLKAVPNGVDMYGNPTSWRALGENGTSFGVSPLSGVMVYDNLLRCSIVGSIRLLADELADIVRTKSVNRQHAKQPVTLVGDQAYRQQMLNIYKQIAGNEPAIIATKGSRDIQIDAVKTGGEYIGDKLNEDFRQTLNMALTVLGISNLPFKAERQTADEIQDYDEPTELLALSPLKSRRQACEQFNERFAGGVYGGVRLEEIECVWAEDIESKTYNFTHDMERMFEEGEADGRVSDVQAL